MVACSFQNILIECKGEFSDLETLSSEYIFIVLSEVGLKPCTNLAQSYKICEGHKNEFIKKNSLRRRRTLCQIPSLVSSHPDVDHTNDVVIDGNFVPRRKQTKKVASRGLKAADVIHLIRTSGMTLPINTPCCTNCLKKLRQDLCGNRCSICATDINDTCTSLIKAKAQQLSTASPQYLGEETWNEEEEAVKAPPPKKQKKNSLEFPCSIQGHLEVEDSQGQAELQKLNNQLSQQTDVEFTDLSTTGVTDESSQDFSQNSTESYTQSYKIDVLNDYLKAMKLPTFSTEERKQWNNYVKSAKSGYCKRFLEVFQSVVCSVFPKSADEVLDTIQHVMSKPDADGNSKDHVSENTFIPLIQAYRCAETCHHRCQILSFLTQTMSFKEIHQMLPEVTYSKFYTAKNHAKIVGPGLPSTVPVSRQRMDPVKLDNFLDFITSEHIVRDLPFGERKIKMSDGSVMELPNVVHSMGASDVINQYKSYCRENEITPLGDSTMYRIISQCGAKVRTSLEGIDYFVAEASRGFGTLSDVLDELVKIQALSQQQSKDAASLLLKCKQYLRTDFKVHLKESSEVADHCQTYALSDPSKTAFSKECQHNHIYVCVSCEQLKELTSSVLKTIQCAIQDNLNRETTELINDLHFKAKNAIESIYNLKKHIVRCKNQDLAKNTLFDTMSDEEILLICDWSMKFLPKRFREDQSDWFGKRGISWHITMAFQKINGVVESLGFVHIFKSQISQDSVTTAAIILDVMDSILKFIDNAKFHLWSDNAGCYKSTEMMSILCKNENVLSFNFCESQNGKGPCDRTGATLKSAIRRYINQGHDVLNASSMKQGIERMMKSVKYRVSVVEFTTKKQAVKGIPAIGSYSNFTFEESGIHVWKAYGVGEGLLIQTDKIPSVETPRLTVLEEPQDIQFHQLSNKKADKDETLLLHCTTDGCTEEFSSEKELLHHQFVGKCRLEMEFTSNSDVMKKKYYEKLSESSFLCGVLSLSAETKELSETESDLTVGWAQKTERKCKRFNKNQKDYLMNKFNQGILTGFKEDPFNVSESMLTAKNVDGTRKFIYDEILSVTQITSFFSRMCKKNKEDDDLEARREEEINDIRQEFLKE